MQRLRTAPLIARLALVWFALFIGSAMASPWVKPTALQMVCTSGGAMKVVVTGADGEAAIGVSSCIDCPLCVPAALMPPPPAIALPVPTGWSSLRALLAASPTAWVTRAPLPARGPPAFS